ncbi:MAG TPA: hypothetical protein VFX50_06880 [Gemmatimonadales bacterium]|nr:hypothetical protein [Gemmatimonadales bacterium]
MDMPRDSLHRATIDKEILDTLIRAKVRSIAGCEGVAAMPVVWRERHNGCNWMVPGWTGDAPAVETCRERVHDYLRFLAQQFDIADEG